jgi:uncharacterized membrane protein
MEKKFSIEESVRFSWEMLKNNFWLIISLQAIIILVGIFPDIMDYIFNSNPDMGLALLAIAILAYILQLVMGIGMIKILLGLYENIKPKSVMELFSATNYFVRYLLASMVYGLIVIGGFLLLIVPGIIWSIKYQFFAYFIVDKNMSPMDALKASARITNGQKGQLLLFSCAMLLLNIAGFLALGIGILVTVPLTSIAIVYVFRKLSDTDEEQVAGLTESIPVPTQNEA